MIFGILCVVAYIGAAAFVIYKADKAYREDNIKNLIMWLAILIMMSIN